MSLLSRFRRRKADKLLRAGKVSEAMALYKKGRAWDGLVAAHERLGDFVSAARVAGEAGLYERAAQMFEKAAQYREAAEMWIKLSLPDRAAANLEKVKEYEEAAALFERAQMPLRAAAALGRAGRHGEAARLYEQAGDTQKAIEMYRAAGLLEDIGRILEESGDIEEAARAYQEAGAAAKAAELFAKLDRPLDSARCCLELGERRKAGDRFAACEHLLEAADAYSEDESAADRAAVIFSKVLRSEQAWQRELEGPLICSGISPTGGFVAVGAARKLRMLNEKGELLWRFTPTWGGHPLCLALSEEGTVVLGCNDGRLYCLDCNKKVLWTSELGARPLKVAVKPSGDCIVCCTEGNVAVCLDGEGSRRWEYRSEHIIWDVSVSPGGKVVAMAMADGSCRIVTDACKLIGKYKTSGWVHSVSIDDNATLALACGMQGVELVDGGTFAPVWSRRDSSPVHNVALLAGNGVLSVGDDEALLRDDGGTVIWRHASDSRLLGGHIDRERRTVVLRRVKKKLLRINLHHCKEQAAECFAKSKNYEEAGRLYEAIMDHERASEMFCNASDYANAARNAEIAGHVRQAAELYERAENFARAAELYESIGDREKAAAHYSRIGQLARAGALLEKSGNFAGAAGLFEQAGQYGKAGRLYEAAGDTPAAVAALKRHVKGNPGDNEKRFKLGRLLQAAGEYDEAIEQFQYAAAADELRRKSSMHVAECFLGKEMYDIAIERFEACLEKGERASRRNLDVFYGLGRAYHLSGNYREAKRIYESILGVDYRHGDVAQRLEDVRKLSGVFDGQASTAVGDSQTIAAGDAFQKLSAEKKERYVPIRKLGQGGMGTVYLAEDRRLNRKVALKMLPSSLQSDEKMRLRMVREAQLAARVVHPNVVGVFDVGQEQGSCYVSMEYVEGETLRELLEAKGTFDPEECVQLLLQVTEGLGYAHAKGLAHRDIKPENIMVTENGTVKIMDFGLALAVGATRVTMPGAVCGTPLYMAPEQVRGDDDLGQAVDTYAIGCMAYELLSGKPPFAEGNIAAQHLNKTPAPLKDVNPDVPPSLDAVVMKCLEKKVAERYPDGASLNAALRDVQKAMHSGDDQTSS